MFGAKKASISSGEQMETILGKDTKFKGTIQATGAVRFDGQFEGDVSTTSDIVIGETGSLKAQIKAKNVTIAGTVTGNMDVLEKLELLPTAKLFGDIKVGVLIVGEGATYKGACEMRQENSSQDKKELLKVAATAK